MKMRPLPLLLVTLLLGACAAPPAVIEREQRPSPLYEITVRALGPARVSNDGFDARFEFEVTSPHDLQRNSLVQELQQVFTLEYKDGTTRKRTLTLVEAFKLRFSHVDSARRFHYRIFTGQSDRHSMQGVNDLSSDVVAVRIERRVFAYVANVHGADFTAAGFAHLPSNEDGSVVSKVPTRFNEGYQRYHETRGEILHSGDARGLTYVIDYRLVRDRGQSPQFIVDHGGGYGAVKSPSVVWTR